MRRDQDRSKQDAGEARRDVADGSLGMRLAALAVAIAISRIAGQRSGGTTRDGRPSRQPERAADGTGRGRDAASPTDIPPAGWRDIAWRVFGQIGDDRILAVAAGVTFYGLLSVFPAIAALVALYGLVADPGTINDHIASLSGFLPSGAIDIVGQQVQRITSKGGGTLGVTFLISLALSLWSSNAGMKAVFDALNVAYDEKETRNFFVLNLWSLGFTLAAMLFLVLAMSSVVVIPVVLNFIGLGGVTAWLIWLGRWPLLIVVTLAAIAVLYRYGPSRAQPRWRWITPGSLMAAVGWLVFSMLFSWYVGSFGNYNETYGSLGAAIGFMTWMWLSTTILLVGAELNAETENQSAADPKAPGTPVQN